MCKCPMNHVMLHGQRLKVQTKVKIVTIAVIIMFYGLLCQQIAAEILLMSSDSLTEELSKQFMVFQQVLAPESAVNPTDTSTTGMDSFHDCASNSILYEFLVELFGERLLLMLECRKKWNKYSTNTCADSKKEGSSSEMISPRTQAYIDESFRRHQMKEGFVSLHHLVSSQRLVTMKKPLVATISPVNCHPFSIRMYRLPIMHNVLELSHSSPVRTYRHQRQGGSGGGSTTSGVGKGRLKGVRRHFMNLNYSCNSVGSWWL